MPEAPASLPEPDKKPPVERPVWFNPQVWHYQQAERFVQELCAVSSAYDAESVPEHDENEIDATDYALFAMARKLEPVTPILTTSTTIDPSLCFAEGVLSSGERVCVNAHKNLLLATEELFNSVQILLNAHGAHRGSGPKKDEAGCSFGALARFYAEWCDLQKSEENPERKRLLNDLSLARNNLCVHRVPTRTFRETSRGYVVYCKGDGQPPMIWVDIETMQNFFRAVRSLWLEVLDKFRGGPEKVHPDERKLFEWEPPSSS